MNDVDAARGAASWARFAASLGAAGAGRLRPAVADRLVPAAYWAAPRSSTSASRTLVTARKAMAQEFTRGGSVADAFAATARPIPDNPRIPGARCRTVSPTTASRSRAGREAARASRSPSCARCRRARRSRATTASRAGARSASGRARSSPRCSTRSRPKAKARYVVFHCADPMDDDGTRRTTRASTWTMRTTRRRSSPTS